MAMMIGLAQGSASRQAVAAAASAIFRSRDNVAVNSNINGIQTHEQVRAEVEILAGPSLGIGGLCKILREGGYNDLAATISNTHRMRKVDAHPPSAIARRVAAALEKLGFGRGDVEGIAPAMKVADDVDNHDDLHGDNEFRCDSNDNNDNKDILGDLVGDWTSIENPKIKVMRLPMGSYVSFEPSLGTLTKITECDDSVEVKWLSTG